MAIPKITQGITIPPAPPTGIYDADFQTKVNNLLTWYNTHAIEETTFIEQLNLLVAGINNSLPSVEAAIEASGLANFKGVCGEDGTPTSGFQKGWTVFKDNNFYYCLNDTDSCPPTSDWKQLVGKELDSLSVSGLSMFGTEENRVKIIENELWLYSGFGTLEQRAFVINKNNSDDGVSFKILDADGNQIGDSIIFDNLTKTWVVGKPKLLFDGDIVSGDVPLQYNMNTFNFLVVNVKNDYLHEHTFNHLVKIDDFIVNTAPTSIFELDGSAVSFIYKDDTTVQLTANDAQYHILKIWGF